MPMMLNTMWAAIDATIVPRIDLIDPNPGSPASSICSNMKSCPRSGAVDEPEQRRGRQRTRPEAVAVTRNRTPR